MFIIFVFCSLQLLHIIVVLILELVLVQYNNGWIILHVLVQNSYYYYVLILWLECTIVDTVKMSVWNVLEQKKVHFIYYSILCLQYKKGISVNNNIWLVDSHNISSGHVEVHSHNVWDTICNDLCHSNDAKVVCRMLNFHDNGK